MLSSEVQQDSIASTRARGSSKQYFSYMNCLRYLRTTGRISFLEKCVVRTSKNRFDKSNPKISTPSNKFISKLSMLSSVFYRDVRIQYSCVT
jgi:hypothetical protein